MLELHKTQVPYLDANAQVHVRRGDLSGLTMAVAIHRTVDGRALGGCRLEPYPDPEAAVSDVKRLARAMSFKAAVAGLRIGGGKGVIAAPPDARLSQELRRRALRDFAELVESLGGRYITAQDAGTTAEDIAYLARFTAHVSGRPVELGGSGDPSPYTAHGVEVGLRETLGSLQGTHVAIIGLGHVGAALADRLIRAGADLTVTDIDPAKRRVAERLGARWVEPGGALDLEADVLAPCALGGTLTPDAVSRLRVGIVAGAANNQLADDSVAELLSERGIVWAPDFVINAGGLIAVVDELDGFDRERTDRSIEAIGDTLREVYRRAHNRRATTLAAAGSLAFERAASN